jgi:hypothetical protein
MKKLFLLFSHKLTKFQSDEAKNKLGIQEFIYLPEEIQKIWSNISPKGELSENQLGFIKKYLLENSNDKDYVLIQGDFGAVYNMVNWCFDNNIVPIYSTTERVYEEIVLEDGSIETKHLFKHIEFRNYK